MRKSLLPLLVAPLLSSGAFAHDDEHPYYLDLGLGLVFADSAQPPNGPEVDFDTGFFGALAVGRPFAHTGAVTWALEGELLQTNFDLDENDLPSFPGTGDKHGSATALLANLVGEWELTSDVGLYFGAGIGFALDVQYETFNSGNYNQIDTDGVATQAQLGMNYHLGDAYEVLVGYRFFATEDVAVQDLVTSTVADVEFTNHVFELSFRWGI